MSLNILEENEFIFSNTRWKNTKSVGTESAICMV